MYETLGLSLEPRQAAVVFALIIGLAFGALAEVTRFCLRRAVAGDAGERAPAAAVWLAALATATLGTGAAVHFGLISFDAHRFHAADLPWLAIVVGGGLFGAGMVLARGCAGRLTVLAGSGNLRSVFGLILFAVVGHATLKGVLAPVRTALSEPTLTLATPALPQIATVIIALAATLAALRLGAPRRDLALGALLGLLVPAAWIGTGFVLLDEFDPIAFEGLSFTQPTAEALFWTIAASSIPAGFGTGLIGGVIAGAALSSLIGGRFEWQSFSSPQQTGRSMIGAALMGIGAPLAGGCTVGAGLSGVPTLSIAALLALGAIVAGGLVTAALTRRGVVSLSAAGRATPAQ